MMAAALVRLGQALRGLEGTWLREAARAAIAGAITDDPLTTTGLGELIDAYLPED